MFRTPKSLSARDQEDHTALMCAALAGQAPIVEGLLKVGTSVNAQDHEGRTALMFAAINSHSDTVKLLLDHGAEVNARANDGETALMLAVCSGATDIVQLLLDRGADVSGRITISGKTTLAIAKEHGYPKIVDLIEEAIARKPSFALRHT